MLNPGIKVLLVDDSAVLRRNLKKLLVGRPGIGAIYEADCVGSFREQYAADMPDAVIVDLQLPDGSGLEVLSHIAAQSTRPLVVVLTNFPSRHNRERVQALGFEHFLDKSFEYERLIELLGTLRDKEVC